MVLAFALMLGSGAALAAPIFQGRLARERRSHPPTRREGAEPECGFIVLFVALFSPESWSDANRKFREEHTSRRREKAMMGELLPQPRLSRDLNACRIPSRAR